MTLVAPATTCVLSDNSEQARCTQLPAPRWDSWIEGQGVTPGQITALTSWLGWGDTGVGVSWPAYPSALHRWAGDQPAHGSHAEPWELGSHGKSCSHLLHSWSCQPLSQIPVDRPYSLKCARWASASGNVVPGSSQVPESHPDLLGEALGEWGREAWQAPALTSSSGF